MKDLQEAHNITAYVERKKRVLAEDDTTDTDFDIKTNKVETYYEPMQGRMFRGSPFRSDRMQDESDTQKIDITFVTRVNIVKDGDVVLVSKSRSKVVTVDLREDVFYIGLSLI